MFLFSQAPWTIAELVVPNLSGKPFPINARWSNAIPGADRMWVASLYSGCLAAVFALLSFRLWGKRRRQVWLSRIGLFFAVGSFGWYGLGWLAGEFVDLSLLPIRIGPQVGGIYWLLTVCLPKYILFRYPAKLFVIAALTMCVLAGLSVGRLPRCRSRMLVMLSCGVVGCVIGLLVLPSLESSLQRFWETVPADPLVGPFAAENASHNLSHSLGHLSMALAAAGMLIAFVRRRRLLLGPALVLIATVDILVANHWMIAEIDATAFASIENPDENISFPWQFSYPPVWSTESSSNRLEEIVLWQQRMLFPKHHLSVPIRNEFSFSSIQRRTVAINRITKLLNFFSIYEGRDHAFLTRMRPFQPDGRWRANVIEQRNGYYKIETDTPVDSMLCIQNLFLPDWHARITTGEFGRSAEVDIHRWIYSLQAIEIPSGKCIVELSYRPQAFYRGAWISGIGWSILLLLTGYRWLGGNRNEKGVN